MYSNSIILDYFSKDYFLKILLHNMYFKSSINPFFWYKTKQIYRVMKLHGYKTEILLSLFPRLLRSRKVSSFWNHVLYLV